MAGSCEQCNEQSDSINDRKFLDWLINRLTRRYTVTNELERVWIEEVAVYLKLQSRKFPGATEEHQEIFQADSRSPS